MGAGLASADVINISPPTYPAANGCSPWPLALSYDANPLQAEVNNADPGDTIIMAAGEYYLECPVYVTKPLTILGAGAGEAPNSDGTDRTTGETKLLTSSENPNGYYGIHIYSSGVTIDGLYFKDSPGAPAYRNTIAVLPLGTPSGTYADISVLNNYMDGLAAGSRHFAWGGQAANVVINNLVLSGNVIISRDTTSGYEPIGFRGGCVPWPSGGNPPCYVGTIVLNGFVMTDNYITAAGYYGSVLNMTVNTIAPDSIIEGNEFVGVPPGTCAFTKHPDALTPMIYVTGDNIGLVPGDCAGQVIFPCAIAIDAPELITPNMVLVEIPVEACGGEVTVTCHKLTKKGKEVDKSESCDVVIGDGVVTIVDSGGVGDIITITVTGDEAVEAVINVVNPGHNKDLWKE